MTTQGSTRLPRTGSITIDSLAAYLVSIIDRLSALELEAIDLGARAEMTEADVETRGAELALEAVAERNEAARKAQHTVLCAADGEYRAAEERCAAARRERDVLAVTISTEKRMLHALTTLMNAHGRTE